MRLAAQSGRARTVRLRIGLCLLFLGLAVPAAALVFQAYQQLEFETFFRYQEQAVSLTDRIDRRLAADARSLASRPVDDFSFFREPQAGVSGRSPLAAYPPPGGPAGLLGYFQIGPGGEYSTPMLPADDSGRERAGLTVEDYASRSMRSAELLAMLRAAEFVEDGRAESGADTSAYSEEAIEESTADTAPPLRRRNAAPASAAPEIPGPANNTDDEIESRENLTAESPAVDEDTASTLQPAPSLGKLRDLKLDDELQQKSAALLDRQQANAGSLRIETDAAEPASGAAREEKESGGGPASVEERVSTFAAETEPFRFGLLSGGHGVLFRNVWISGERFVQGALLDIDTFLDTEIAREYNDSPLAQMSVLVVGIGDDIVRIISADDSGQDDQYSSRASDLDGSLLHRSRLSAPFASLSLVFSVTDLPPGPAADVLGWTAAVLGVVLAGGLWGLYRVGISHIRLAQQQQDFVAAVSHELKTPLTSIRMYGEMLRSGWVDDEKRDDYYAFIHDESERLTRLIDNVLQLARISRSEANFELRSVAVGELIDMLGSKLAEPVERAGFRLELVAAPEVAETLVRVDTDSFLQIAINLVDNALKFSRKAEKKTVICRFDAGAGDSVVFSVRDFGPGIPKSQMKRIFELFYRPKSELTRETVGTGIGLAIVSTLARGMGGSVDASNRSPGAEFRVTLTAASSNDPEADD